MKCYLPSVLVREPEEISRREPIPIADFIERSEVTEILVAHFLGIRPAIKMVSSEFADSAIYRMQIAFDIFSKRINSPAELESKTTESWNISRRWL